MDPNTSRSNPTPWQYSKTLGGYYLYISQTDEILHQDGRRFPRPQQLSRDSLRDAVWNGPLPQAQGSGTRATYTQTQPGQAQASGVPGFRPNASQGLANQTHTTQTNASKKSQTQTQLGQGRRVPASQLHVTQANVGQTRASQAHVGQAYAGQPNAGQPNAGQTHNAQMPSSQIQAPHQVRSNNTQVILPQATLKHNVPQPPTPSRASTSDRSVATLQSQKGHSHNDGSPKPPMQQPTTTSNLHSNERRADCLHSTNVNMSPAKAHGVAFEGNQTNTGVSFKAKSISLQYTVVEVSSSKDSNWSKEFAKDVAMLVQSGWRHDEAFAQINRKLHNERSGTGVGRQTAHISKKDDVKVKEIDKEDETDDSDDESTRERCSKDVAKTTHKDTLQQASSKQKGRENSGGSNRNNHKKIQEESSEPDDDDDNDDEETEEEDEDNNSDEADETEGDEEPSDVQRDSVSKLKSGATGAIFNKPNLTAGQVTAEQTRSTQAVHPLKLSHISSTQNHQSFQQSSRSHHGSWSRPQPPLPGSVSAQAAQRIMPGLASHVLPQSILLAKSGAQAVISTATLPLHPKPGASGSDKAVTCGGGGGHFPHQYTETPQTRHQLHVTRADCSSRQTVLESITTTRSSEPNGNFTSIARSPLNPSQGHSSLQPGAISANVNRTDTRSRQYDSTSATVERPCENCRKKDEAGCIQHAREARLINIIRHLVRKTGIDPLLRRSLEQDAPQLLAEYNQLIVDARKSNEVDNMMSMRHCNQLLQDNGMSTVREHVGNAHREMVVETRASSVQVTGSFKQTEKLLKQLPFYPWNMVAVSTSSSEHFDALVREMQGIGIYM